jgi:hypothetical protein
METPQINARSYSNLRNYRSHPPPNYGKGIYAPYFAASPMRSSFSRGEIVENNVSSGPNDYFNYSNFSNYINDNYVNDKMLRQKKQ